MTFWGHVSPLTRWCKRNCPGTSFWAVGEKPAPGSFSWKDDFKVFVNNLTARET